MRDTKRQVKDHEHKPAVSHPGKKVYRTPDLTVYGDIAMVTLAKGGNKNDGGPSFPSTKA